MDLRAVAQTPKLVKITLDDPAIVETYGESIDFWMYDRQDISTYLRFSTIKDNTTELIAVVRDLVRDKSGNQMLAENQVLPLDIMTSMIQAVTQHLGNSTSQTTAGSETLTAS